MANNKTLLIILNVIVIVAGFTQGMLLTVLSVILEQDGISASVNGLHATGVYIGILLASPFMEKPIHKFGYKPVMLTGAMIVVISLFLFPSWKILWFWFVLRILIGIGIEMLHIASQTWLTSITLKNRRGVVMAVYGLCFGVGFTIGPMMLRVLTINESLPFIISAIFCALTLTGIFLLRNQYPERIEGEHPSNSFARFTNAWKLGWVAFLFPLAYGFLEATLNGVFPAYGVSIGYDVATLAIILPCFALGSIIFQIPIGTLSDKVGRHKILTILISGGVVSFFLLTFWENSTIAMIGFLILAGICVGSLFSLGISYMTDLLPDELLPAGNIICSIAFSIGSVTGPFISGLFIEHFKGFSFFYIFVFMLLAVLFALLITGRGFGKEYPQNEVHIHTHG